MNIQSISPVKFGKNETTQPAKRRENTDRAATVKDLYESEDRIMAHNEALINKQNQALANTFVAIVNMHKQEWAKNHCNCNCDCHKNAEKPTDKTDNKDD